MLALRELRYRLARIDSPAGPVYAAVDCMIGKRYALS